MVRQKQLRAMETHHNEEQVHADAIGLYEITVEHMAHDHGYPLLLLLVMRRVAIEQDSTPPYVMWQRPRWLV